MTPVAVFAKVHNRGSASKAFIDELVDWGKHEDYRTFQISLDKDIYAKVRDELGGPFGDDIAIRTAVMLEVMRVLALLESGSDDAKAWNCGVDTSKAQHNTNENAEAGRWQVSFDSRNLHPSLRAILAEAEIHDGLTFQRRMKADHKLAMKYVATMLRHNTKHNGPLYKGAEREAAWPKRPNLWKEEESIYPYLSKLAVREFYTMLLS